MTTRRTYLLAVPHGCPGWGRACYPTDELCTQQHVLVGERVYHERELPSSMWRRLEERRKAGLS